MARIVDLGKIRDEREQATRTELNILDAQIADADAASKAAAAKALSDLPDAGDRPAFDELPAPMQRALIEAQERREKADAVKSERSKELNGRGGLDPVRYGDWETKGITSDF